MPPEPHNFRYYNTPSNTPIPPSLSNFTIKARTGTDLWRTPSRDTFTAHVLYTPAPANFYRAEVTIYFSLDRAREWDQGGLVIFAGPPPTTSHRTTDAPVGKWVKAGIEYTEGRALASSVSASTDGADRSVVELPQGVSEVRVAVERQAQTLIVWFDDGVEWKRLREVNWFFHQVEEKNVRVGVYAGRPATEQSGVAQSELVVEFEGFEIF
ncbi:hypothetical protein EX30DRAFT_372535 [Ascodesmis nigricans]|uniref:DUF1349-domain-containing protein n=1 Tax=Ascodesmis nigricans TaxID=341454 RepID=A0A4S2MU52_9PEZI|nr:hypothetical protein EX30DRAFT_372535 [Ascodesmis nigricans]